MSCFKKANLILLLFLLLFNLPCSSKKVQKFINKNITDISQIKVKKKTRKLIIKKNEIDSIANFTCPEKLKKLVLNSNSIEGMGNLNLNSKLKVFELADNDLDSIEGINFGDSQLIKFSVDYNNFTTFNGESLSNNIKILDYSNNSLSEIINISNGNNFEVLNLRINNLSGFDGSNFQKLQTLILSTNPIESFANIINLPSSLKQLWVGGFQYGSDLENFVIPDSVTSLVLGGTFIDESDVARLSFPPNLKSLILIKNNLSSLDGVNFPESLRYLQISGNPIPKQELRSIRRRFKKENPKLKIVF